MYRLLLFPILLFSTSLFAQEPCDELEVSFSYAPHPDGLQFADGSTYSGMLTWYQWDFGDGNTSFFQNPVHAYTLNGIYEVCLTIGITVETDQGPLECLESFCAMVEYSDGSGINCDLYTAAFEYELLDGNTVLFYSTSEPFGGDHHWQFGDGTSFSGPQMTHTYNEPGQYSVCMVSVMWNEGTGSFCSSNVCKSLIVGGEPLDCENLFANFTGTIVSGTTLVFHQTTEPQANIFNWDFGDNSNATGPVVTHTFAVPGTYQVCMGAFWWDDLTQDSCFHHHCDLFHIVDSTVCDPGFSAGFGWSHVEGQAWMQATSSFPAMGYLWDLGDGNTGTGEILEHGFAQGEYEVCLSAWYLPEGAMDTCWAIHCSLITIGPGSTSCAELETAFQHESLAAGVQFSNTSSLAGVPYEMLWEFGDGNTSTGNSPLHPYSAPGEYEACLTITTLIGNMSSPDTCISTHCTTVEWSGATGDACAGYGNAFIGTSSGPLEMSFISTAVPVASGYSWTFGDGGTGVGDQVTHTFPQNGSYEVCLTTWWWNEALQDTCWITVCENFNVDGMPGDCDPDFAIDFSWQQFGNVITYTATTNMDAAGIIWYFGDGTNGMGTTVSHLYEPPGPYEVCAVAWYWNEITQDSCWAEQCHVVLWDGSQDCDPDLGVTISASPEGNIVTFIANATPGADGYIWDLGDGTTATGQTITHAFGPPGPYTVCVSIWYWEETIQDSCWAEACITADPYVGIGERGLSEIVRVFPSPAQDQITLDAARGTPLPERIFIYTADGRLVHQDRILGWPHRMNVSELSPGVFLLQLVFGDRSMVERITIE